MNNIFAPIQKYEKIDDDVILVSGIASSESVDNQSEIVKSNAIKEALPDYFSIGGTGALREMHQSKAAGTVFKVEVMNDGNTYIEAKVVDKEACKKIEQGVYKGFSIGGKVLKKEGNIITKLKLTEISLVDRPCNPDALFSMYKSDDFDKSSFKSSEIKYKIASSLKKIISEDKKPSETNKSLETLCIGADNIGRLSLIIQSLICLQECIQYESDVEMDNSPLPNDLTVAISNIYDILARMSAEEADEFNDHKDEIKMSDNIKDEKPSDISDVSKADGSLPSINPKFSSVQSSVNSEQSEQIKPKELDSLFSSVDAIKRKLVEKGYIDDPEIIKPVEIPWAEKSDAANDIKKILSTLQSSVDEISTRLKKVEDSPVEGKAILKNVPNDNYSSAISKGTDASKSDNSLEKVDRSAFSYMQLGDKELLAMDVIKNIHSRKI